MRQQRIYLACSFLVLAGAALATPPAVDDVLRIVLRPGVTATSPVVNLADIAEIHGGTAAERDKLGRLDIIERSPGGGEMIVPRDVVFFRLRLAGWEPSRFRLGGPAHTAIVWPKRPNPRASSETTAKRDEPLSEQSVVRAAEEAVQQRVAGASHEVSIRLLRPVTLPEWERQPADAVSLSATVRGAAAVGRVTVDVAILINGRRRTQVPVLLEVSLEQLAAVAKRRIAAGDVLKMEHLDVERVLVTGKEQYLALEDCLGKRARAVLLPGQRLMESDLEAPSKEDSLLIKARDPVRLMTRAGAVTLTALGEALQDGKEGQIIRVRNTDSNKIVSGRVIERAVVEVQH